MKKFSDWFDENLEVGGYPILVNKNFDYNKYDIVINVSDEWYQDTYDTISRYGLIQHWFPMNECKRDIGLNSIFGAMVILYNAEKLNKKVYLHCHAGVNRSVTVECCYHYMRMGKHLDLDYGSYINPLIASCHRGYLPPKAEMEKFLKNISKRLEEAQNHLMGGYLDDVKLNSINNF